MTANFSMIDAGGPIYLRDFGGVGAPMLLVHSMGGSHAEWLGAAPSLAKQHRVFALDLPGFGRSPLSGRPGTVEDGAQVVETVLKHLGKAPALVVGNSMGGLIAAVAASRYHESLRGVVLLNSALPIMRRINVRRRSLLRFATYSVPVGGPKLVALYVLSKGAKQMLLETLPRITADPRRVDAAVLAGMTESMEVQLKSRDPMLGYCLGARSVAGHLVRRQRELAMFQRIRCPVLVIHGAKDPLIKVENARLVSKALPAWELHILPESGHMPHLEQPQEVAEAINRWSAGLVG